METSSELHKKIMRQVLLIQLKTPFTIASSLVFFAIMADTWHIIAEIAGKNMRIYYGLFAGLTYFNLFKSVDLPDITIVLADVILAGYLAYIFLNFGKTRKKVEHPAYGFFEHAYHHLFRVPARNILKLYKWRWS